MNKIFDTHVHFNMNVDNISLDFYNQIHESKLSGYLLILNTDQEKKFFKEVFIEKFKKDNTAKLAVLLNYKNKKDYEFLEFLNLENISYCIKIHPRISDIRKSDFDNLFNSLKKIKFENLIIDAFYYGSNIENHINIELCIFLAQKLFDKNILIAHSGGHKILECMLYTRELKNIYYDLSLTIKYFKGTSVKYDINNFIKYNWNRIVFGSDYPDFCIKDALEEFLNYCRDISIDNFKVKNMLYDNAMSYLANQ